MPVTIKYSDTKKDKIHDAMKHKGWSKTENCPAIQEASFWMLSEAFQKKALPLEKGLTQKQVEELKIFQEKNIKKLFNTFKKRLYTDIKNSIESGELKAQGISYGTWRNFVNGKAINIEAFKAYCQVLGENWEEIQEPPDTKSKRTPNEGNDLEESRANYVGISGTKGSSTFTDTLPQIQAVRIFGYYDQPRIQLRGLNFKENAKVLVGEVEIPVVISTQTLLEALLPPAFSGMVKVVVDSHESQEIYCAAPSDKQQHTNLYEVVKAEIPLYADQHCTCQRPGVVGLLKHPIGGRADVLDIIPTYPGIYKASYYITNEVFDERTSVGETWYRDPDKDEINYAWTSLFIRAPHIVCQVGQEKLGGISIFPNPIKTEVDDCRVLLVKAWKKYGLIEIEVDITNKVLFESLDHSIAVVRNGVVYPQRVGKTLIQCEFEGFFDSVELSVGQYNKGDKIVYFQGFRELQQIRFDADDNLYFCQQPNSVYKLSPQGKPEEIIRLSTPDTIKIRMNCIAIYSDKKLYVNDLLNGVCLEFTWDGDRKKYENREFATCIEGAKKGITLDSKGNIFVAVPVRTGYQQGYIIHIHPDGSETAFCTEDAPYWLALDSQGNICTPSDKNLAVHVYNREGNLIKIIPYGIQDRATDILIDPEGSIYLPLYYGKNILKITPMDLNARCEIIAKGINSPSGIAKDSQGRIYVLSLQAQDSFIIKTF